MILKQPLSTFSTEEVCIYIYNSAPIIVSVLLCKGQVVIGLEDVSYTVSEDMLTQEVCAIIREGSIGRDVIVTLSTQPRSANGGQSLLYIIIYNIIYSVSVTLLI